MGIAPCSIMCLLIGNGSISFAATAALRSQRMLVELIPWRPRSQASPQPSFPTPPAPPARHQAARSRRLRQN
jgi:hypothetical protein